MYTHPHFEKRHDSSQISKKQICFLLRRCLRSATAVGQMVKFEMLVLLVATFPFDQDETRALNLYYIKSKIDDVTCVIGDKFVFSFPPIFDDWRKEISHIDELIYQKQFDIE